jgi:hypothetical protein
MDIVRMSNVRTSHGSRHLPLTLLCHIDMAGGVTANLPGFLLFRTLRGLGRIAAPAASRMRRQTDD